MSKKKNNGIANEFSFLLDYGFVLETYICPPDLEYVYVRGDVRIIVSYYLGVLDSYEKTMCFDVELIIADKRKNLLHRADVFGNDKINKLSIDIATLDALERANIYAVFLKDNIKEILSKTKIN